MKTFDILLSGGIAIDGQVKRPGRIVSVDERLARQLLHRGKGVLVDGQPGFAESTALAEPTPAEPPADAPTPAEAPDWASMTVAQLREHLPDAPARATKADLIALLEQRETNPEE